jgi:hypothetical protein
MINEAMRAYEYTPASEPKSTSPSDVLQAMGVLKIGKAAGRNGIPNRFLRYLPLRTVTFLTKIFNSVLRRQYFPPAWKHPRMVFIPTLGRYPTLPSSYSPVTLFDSVDKLFEKILFTRVLREVNGRELLRDEQFGFRPRHSTTLQLARLVERVSRNIHEKRLTGVVFPDVAKSLDTVWVKASFKS